MKKIDHYKAIIVAKEVAELHDVIDPSRQVEIDAVLLANAYIALHAERRKAREIFWFQVMRITLVVTFFISVIHSCT